MLRSASILALLTGLGLTPALAADWQWEEEWVEEARGPLTTEPKDWTELGDDSDSMGFEFGLRYFYSMGAQQYSSGGDTFSSTDKTHALEGHLRIEDDVTQTYAKAWGGYSFATDGTYNNDGSSGPITDGNIGYAGADIGYNMLGNGDVGFGPLLGYAYSGDMLNTGRENFTTATVGQTLPFDAVTGQAILPGNSLPNSISAHALRLGIQTKADFGEFMDVSAEIAAVPYANLSGTLGVAGIASSYNPVTGITVAQSSATEISGWGYGAMGEVMVGFRPAENVVFRIGGRASYLQGNADTTINTVIAQDAQDTDLVTPGFEVPAQVIGSQSYISTANPFSMFRYGLLAELTYKF